MERENLLALLILIVTGLTVAIFAAMPLGLAAHPESEGQERAAWRRIWLPLVPAACIFAFFVGWALQEPDATEESVAPWVLLVAAPSALIVLRAVFRAMCSALQTAQGQPAATVGLLRPRVVLGSSLIASLEPQALRAICEHEAAHARHRDPLRIWLAQLATDLQWPSRRAGDRLRSWLRVLEEERDHEAREHGADGAALAAGLLAAARLARRSQVRAAALATGPEEALQRRITFLLAPRRSSKPTRIGQWGWALAVLLLLALAGEGGLANGEALVHALPGLRCEILPYTAELAISPVTR